MPCSQEITLDIPITPNIVREDSPIQLEEFTNLSSNKRTVTDLFGDVEDINFDEIQLPSKRAKTEEETDMDLIDKIIEGRRLRQILAEPTKLQNDNKSGYVAKDNLSLDIPRYFMISC